MTLEDPKNLAKINKWSTGGWQVSPMSRWSVLVWSRNQPVRYGNPGVDSLGTWINRWIFNRIELRLTGTASKLGVSWSWQIRLLNTVYLMYPVAIRSWRQCVPTSSTSVSFLPERAGLRLENFRKRKKLTKVDVSRTRSKHLLRNWQVNSSASKTSIVKTQLQRSPDFQRS